MSDPVPSPATCPDEDARTPAARPDEDARTPAARPDEDARTFEELLAELEAVTEALATGELGIEAATDLYERAERLHALAAARLAQVQARVDALRDARPG